MWHHIIALMHSYLVMQEEVGESGTPHIQGYIHFDNARNLTQMRGLFSLGPGIGHGTHFEIAVGSPAQNTEYCTKDEARMEGGRRIIVGGMYYLNMSLT